MISTNKKQKTKIQRVNSRRTYPNRKISFLTPQTATPWVNQSWMVFDSGSWPCQVFPSDTWINESGCRSCLSTLSRPENQRRDFANSLKLDYFPAFVSAVISLPDLIPDPHQPHQKRPSFIAKLAFPVCPSLLLACLQKWPAGIHFSFFFPKGPLSPLTSGTKDSTGPLQLLPSWGRWGDSPEWATKTRLKHLTL